MTFGASRSAPRAFVPEKGAWGLRGATAVDLELVGEEALGEALTLAWQNTNAKGLAR